MEHDEVSERNSLNELSGAEWLYFTKSILTTSYPSAYGHALRKEHGANKPPQLMCQLIEFVTKPGARVLDPFAGVGGTLIGAAICKKPREAVGIEINQKWVDIYHRVIAENKDTLLPQQLLHGDCLQLLETLEEASFDFIATDPPYNIHFEQTMSNNRYAENHVDLARRARRHGFVPKGEIIWYQTGTRLRPYGYPFAYIPNIAHQYIVVLQKPR